jgi:hypothetical protein
MESKRIIIDGKSFDLNNPEEKKAAIKAWLRSKSSNGSRPSPPGGSEESDPVSPSKEPGYTDHQS